MCYTHSNNIDEIVLYESHTIYALTLYCNATMRNTGIGPVKVRIMTDYRPCFDYLDPTASFSPIITHTNAYIIKYSVILHNA